MADAGQFTIIDDKDATVVYTGTWVTGGTTHEHAGTVSSSVKVGDSFLVPFTGSATTVTSSSSGSDSYQQLFWKSNSVSSGAHKLVVTMKSVNNVGDGEGTIWFDYFNVTTAATSDTPTSSTATSSSPATNTAAAVVTHSKSHTAVIAGVIVALLLLALLAAALFQRMRRARRNTNFGPDMSSPSNGPPVMQPFLTNQTPMTLAGSAPMAASYGAAYGGPAPSGAAYSPGVGGFDPRQTHAGLVAGAFGQPNAYAPIPAKGFAGQAPYGAQPQAQAPYDPYASVGITAMQHPNNNAAPQSSYAPSASSTPSSSQYQNRGPLSVVGGSSTAADPSEYGDSVADLKRRQQQVVNQYEQGISGSAPIVQHTDSGVRALDTGAGPAPT
ncbi:hypothetical protein B0H14DRAFT_2779319 [Mycena olivaceomarginata]|nr:hypothetical protein B0H14DRAFT_2779319 [Mycena olivaceomarginata]